MQENSNRALFINSIVLYCKLAINIVTGLLTTRYALAALGIVDYGLFAVLGSVISFVGIINTIMVAASNRFISVAIGRNNTDEINEQFNISFTIHSAIALLTLVFAIPLGDWYIYNYINFEGNIEDAINVFHYSIIGAIISFIGVPFHGLLMAKERFIVPSIADVLSHILKMIIAFLLINHFQNKLIIYAFSQSGLTVLTTLIYIIYCRINFATIIKYKFCKEKRKYKNVFEFSSWVAFGAFATIGKNQGAAMLVNIFFNTTMNTALGLANSINTLISQFSNSISQPIAPQITKNYASGNLIRCDELLVMSTKFTYLITLCISVPFFVSPKWIFSLWLGYLPPYLIEFAHLIIIDTLILSLNSGISNMIFASGKIRLYQLIVNVLRVSAVVSAYFALKWGEFPYLLFYAYIIFSILIFFAGQWILHKTLNYDNTILWRKSYIPSIIVSVLFFPICFLLRDFRPLLQIIIAEIYLVVLIVLFGLTKSEKEKFISVILKHLNK